MTGPLLSLVEFWKRKEAPVGESLDLAL